MKRCLSTLVPVFNTNRMVEEYLKKCYLPSHHRFVALSADGSKPAAELSKWRRRVLQGWNRVKVEGIEAPTGEMMKVGVEFPVKVRVNLGGLSPNDVEVQLCHGLLDSMGEIATPQALALKPASANGDTTVLYAGSVPCRSSGQFGFSVRVLPKHASLPNLFEPALVTWG
ncbi:Glycogen phosphorylase [Fimbriiglobus ruber]|uniref:Glycogen phosphorylase n=1 Tax=Fimbriiglobus ruber TaxID=1908690 RepID=A0A225DVR9_9BACT|nr:hypothetical protein [Fimbriiglobus ruber]OWK43704.1 Glycogen phosphorylase [Fimbriiglobus ruber]